MKEISKTRLKRMSEILQQISLDTETDANEFDGRLLDGKTVAEYFGIIGAQIQSLADIVKELVDAELKG